MWTEEDLKLLNMVQLRRLAKYYEIKTYKSERKGKLIKKILKLFPSPEEVARAEGPPRSVRIRRAYGEKV